MHFADGDGRTSSGLLLIGAAATLYVACRTAIVALVAPSERGVGSRAIGQWIPVAATALVAVFMRHPEVATAIIFATSVGYLTLVLGMTGSLRPMDESPPHRRIWPFILPATLFCLVVGFHGSITWKHAVMMLAMGIPILGVWLEEHPEELPGVLEQRMMEQDGDPGRLGISWPRTVALLLSVALAVFGGWMAIKGTVATSTSTHLFSSSVIATAVLSPLLVLPALSTASATSETTGTSTAASSLVGSVLLNLCFLLPVVAISWCVRSGWDSPAVAATQPAGQVPKLLAVTRALPYPVAVWQIDTMILAVLGFGLIPVALGRWLIGRTESAFLVLGYAFYILVVVLSSLPPHV